MNNNYIIMYLRKRNYLTSKRWRNFDEKHKEINEYLISLFV
jgi:hypothetical protein